MKNLEETLEAAERDLLSKKDGSEYIELIEQCLECQDILIRRKASCCLPKMGQNKTQNSNIYEFFLKLADDNDPETKENMLWGIGEIAGAGIGDERSIPIICKGMSDENARVRGMAAWAAERIISRLELFSDELILKLNEIEDDSSPYVRKSVSFAKECLKKKM